MKIVVFGPDKRTGALHDGNVVDLCYACAKRLHERVGEPRPLEMAECAGAVEPRAADRG